MSSISPGDSRLIRQNGLLILFYFFVYFDFFGVIFCRFLDLHLQLFLWIFGFVMFCGYFWNFFVSLVFRHECLCARVHGFLVVAVFENMVVQTNGVALVAERDRSPQRVST